MRSIKLLLPVVAATFCGFAAASATASTPASDLVGVPTVVVKYDRATLVNRAGVQTLHGRLRMAAQSVCTPLDSRVLGLREQYGKCVREAVRRGVADVGNENLTNYHRRRALPRMLAAR
jgi:UrcA family protein